MLERGQTRDFEAWLVNVQARGEKEEQQFARVNSEKKFNIERLKPLGVMTFKGNYKSN